MLRQFKKKDIFVDFHFLNIKGLTLLFLLFSFYANGQYNDILSSTSTDIIFKSKSTRLTKESKRQLNSIAILFRSDTSLGIKLSVSYGDLCDNCGSRAWDRIQMIANYLIGVGVNSSQIIPNSSLDGEKNKVEVSIALGTIPPHIPRHPPLRRKEKN